MSDMDKMQQDAVNRAREMYSRRTPSYHAGTFPSGYNGNIKRRVSAAHRSEESFPQSEPANEENITEEQDKPQENAEQSEVSKEESFLDTLLSDKERTLIILLLALLNEEKADTSLMLALMYIIM